MNETARLRTEARKIGVVHPGTQHSWQTARALQDLGMLAWYATSIFYVDSRWPYKAVRYLPGKLKTLALKELKRFYTPALKPENVYTFGASQWLMRLAARLGFRGLATWFMRSNDKSIAKPVRKLMLSKPVDGAWCYDLAALDIFRNAKELGIATILDRTIGHPSQFNVNMENAFAEFPEFFLSKDFRVGQDIIDRADAEHELADVILVGSEFCKSTLVNWSPSTTMQKVRVVPYCYDDTLFKAPARRRRASNAPLRFLFLGQAGPRKGIHLALRAFAKIPRSAANLTIVGDIQVPSHVLAAYIDHVSIGSTVARAEVPDIMARSDCLLFPSYFEGAALSIAEAFASGLGVIQSRNTGMSGLGDCGLVMETLSVEELVRCVMEVVDDPKRLDAWAESGPKIAQAFSFESYRSRLDAELDRLLGGRSGQARRRESGREG